MDNNHYLLTQEENMDHFGICGDTTIGELEHSGIKGMKWGVRRYQNPDGSLTAAGKKRYNKTLEKVRAEEKALREKIKAEKTSASTKSKIDKLNARVDAVNKKKQALKDGKKISDDADNKVKTEAEKEAEKKAYEEAKAKAIKSGSATEVLKFKGDLTPQEMQSVTTRLQWEQSMQGISAKEVAVGKSKTDKLFEKMDDVTTKAVGAAKAWNMAANIVNAFGGLDVPLPKIDTNIGNDNRDTRQKAKQDKKKADEASKPKEKSALDKLKEETAWIDAQNKNREAKRASRAHDAADAKEAAKNNAAKAKADAWGEPEPTRSADTNSQYRSGKKQNDNPETSSQSSKKSLGSEKQKVYEGDVIGEGTSKRSSNSRTYNDVVDVDYWSDVSVSDVPATTRSRGESYVNSMLSLPAPRTEDYDQSSKMRWYG